MSIGDAHRKFPDIKAAQWRHKAYRGWMSLERGLAEVVLAEIHAPAPEQEWQMLSAFLGFVDRHFGNRVMAMNNWGSAKSLKDEAAFAARSCQELRSFDPWASLLPTQQSQKFPF